jgi:hypothetical protein
MFDAPTSFLAARRHHQMNVETGPYRPEDMDLEICGKRNVRTLGGASDGTEGTECCPEVGFSGDRFSPGETGNPLKKTIGDCSCSASVIQEGGIKNGGSRLQTVSRSVFLS